MTLTFENLWQEETPAGTVKGSRIWRGGHSSDRAYAQNWTENEAGRILAGNRPRCRALFQVD
jgi:hypothetical protein